MTERRPHSRIALQRYRVENLHDPEILGLSSFLINYRFADRLFPGALDAVRHVSQWGPTVILTDGDVVFQPRKVERSGLLEAFGGRVLIYIHKERELESIEARFPSDHYVLIDDKVRILAAAKEGWGARLTTVFPKQGHYAYGPELARHPRPDLTLERIADLMAYDQGALLQAARGHDAP